MVQGRNRTLLGIFVGGTLLAIAAMIAIWVFMGPRSVAPEAQDCGSLAQANQQAVGIPEPRVLLPRAGTNLVFAWSFDERADPYKDWTRLYWTDAGTTAAPETTSGSEENPQPRGLEAGDRLGMHMTPLENQQMSRSIPEKQIGFVAVAIEQGVEVQVCVDARGASVGKYTAALEFEDPDVQASPIPVQITVTHGDARVPLVLFMIGVLFAFGLVLLKASASDRVPIVGLIAALVIAVVVALTEIGPLELRSADPTWGANGGDFFMLAAATMFAILGAGALGELGPELKVSLDSKQNGVADDKGNNED